MHESVLLEESLAYLNIKEDSIIVDCTLGYAGHSSNILKRINKGYLFAFDQDRDAIFYSKKRLDRIGTNYTIIKSNFKNLKEELKKSGVSKVDGILFDLGVSSPQLDQKDRGFSIHQDARLDMRMDQDCSFSAYEVVNEYSYEDLVRIFRDYGEEKYATSIAHGIIGSRPIETTLELVEVIKNHVPEKYRREKHPARKVFQAIRIEVNDELNVFKLALEDAMDILKPGGRICVITFHSLEDRICKNMFKEASSIPRQLAKLPIVPEELMPKFKVIANIEPSNQELEKNNRARSSRLRVIEKIKD